MQGYLSADRRSCRHGCALWALAFANVHYSLRHSLITSFDCRQDPISWPARVHIVGPSVTVASSGTPASGFPDGCDCHGVTL